MESTRAFLLTRIKKFRKQENWRICVRMSWNVPSGTAKKKTDSKTGKHVTRTIRCSECSFMTVFNFNWETMKCTC